METGGWKKRLLEWGDEAAQSFIALSSSGLIIIGIVVILWGLSEPHSPALHNHLWSYNFQLSPADECTPPRWDCALSDELENTWICVPRRDDD